MRNLFFVLIGTIVLFSSGYVLADYITKNRYGESREIAETKYSYYQNEFTKIINNLKENEVPYDYIVVSFVEKDHTRNQSVLRFNTYCVDKKTGGGEMNHQKIYQLLGGLYESWIVFMNE